MTVATRHCSTFPVPKPSSRVTEHQHLILEPRPPTLTPHSIKLLAKAAGSPELHHQPPSHCRHLRTSIILLTTYPASPQPATQPVTQPHSQKTANIHVPAREIIPFHLRTAIWVGRPTPDPSRGSPFPRFRSVVFVTDLIFRNGLGDGVIPLFLPFFLPSFRPSS